MESEENSETTPNKPAINRLLSVLNLIEVAHGGDNTNNNVITTWRHHYMTSQLHDGDLAVTVPILMAHLNNVL